MVRRCTGILPLGGRPRWWARISWTMIHDERRYRTAVWRALARSRIPGARGRSRPGSGRSRLERGFPAQSTRVWLPGTGNACLMFLQRQHTRAGRTMGGNRGRPHLSVSPAWDYLRIVLKRKIESPPVHRYPAAGWRIAEARHSEEFVGFGCVWDLDCRLSFVPRLPHARNGVAFPLRFGGRQIRVRLTYGEECCLVDNGAPLNVLARGSPTCPAPGPWSRPSSRHHDRDAARNHRSPPLAPGPARARTPRQHTARS
jgi:hypothetical protein